MRYSKLENELQLIMLLADSVGYTAIEIEQTNEYISSSNLLFARFY